MLLNVVYIKSCRADRISSVLDHVMLSQSYYRSSLFIPIPLEYTLIYLDLSSNMNKEHKQLCDRCYRNWLMLIHVCCVFKTRLSTLTFNLYLHVILID